MSHASQRVTLATSSGVPPQGLNTHEPKLDAAGPTTVAVTSRSGGQGLQGPHFSAEMEGELARDTSNRKRPDTLSERAARRKERRRGWRTQDAVQNSNRWCGKHATTIFRGVNAAFVVCVSLGVARCAQSGPCIGRSSCVR